MKNDLRHVLVVVDMQEDFVFGSLGNYQGADVLHNVVDVINDYVNQYGDDLYIYVTRDTHYSDYLDTLEGKKLPVKHCIKGTDGWEVCSEIIEALEVAKTKNIHVEYIDKNTFGSSELKKKIVDLSLSHDLKIAFTGLCTDICVVSNALLLREALPDTEISVIKKATSGVTPEKEEAALLVMESCQIDII